MQSLLPYYERELALLRGQAESFARRYPRIAGRLAAPDGALQDPHAQRLVQAFALLTARSHKRLDDDLPLFTETLLELLYPHGLRPFPACSIACFDLGAAVAHQDRALAVPRGTLLQARPVRGVACRFATTAPAQLLPLRVVTAGLCPVPPSGTQVPADTSAWLSVHLELGAEVKGWSALGAGHVRLFLDGEPSLVTLLRETLGACVTTVLVQTATQGPWVADAQARPRLVGLEEDEALIDPDPRSPPESRLLTEYFAFPEKFNFLDLPLPAAALRCETRTLGLHYALAGLGTDGAAQRLLGLASAANFVAGCVPVINLFSLQAEPIRLTHTTSTYTVLPDARAAASHEVYAIDRVCRVRRTAQGLAEQAIAPLYGQRHEERLREDAGAAPYWWAQHDDALAARSPGHETQIGLADPRWDPTAAQDDTLCVTVRATNRGLPCRLSIGNPGGDLQLADGSGGPWQEVRLLRKPTAPQRVARRREGLRRLVMQLALHRQGLAAGGLEALRALLRLHDLPHGAATQRLMAGLLALELRDARAAVPGNPFAGTVRGTEVRLSVEEQHFVGSGLHLFAQVLARTLGHQAQLNSFIRLRLLSARTGQVLVDCPPRSGAEVLA